MRLHLSHPISAIAQPEVKTDTIFYSLFGELFLYLKQYKPPHPWRVVVIYPTRRTEREQTFQFGELLALNRVRRIYLDELGEAAENSVGVGVVKLVIEPEATAGELARRLIEQARQQLTDEAIQRDLIDLIETIIVYKLPQKSREEIEAMLGLSELKQTKVYQEALEEGEHIGEQRGEQRGKVQGKLEAIPELIQLGLSLEQIAKALKLSVEVVQQAAQSFHEQNVTAFIQLLNSQRLLFSSQDLAELNQLISPLPDDIEKLSQAIASWCQQEDHSQILDALIQMRQTLTTITLEEISGTNTQTKTPDYPLNKQMLQNAIDYRHR